MGVLLKQSGQIVLFSFPQTDLGEGKLRPALLLGKLPGEYDDWLLCMISSQVHHAISNFHEIIREDDPDFVSSGLKVSSVMTNTRIVSLCNIFFYLRPRAKPQGTQSYEECIVQYITMVQARGFGSNWMIRMKI